MQHLLSAGDLTRDEALLILDTARELSQVSERSVKKLPTLRGRTVVNLFYEDSTRTRISFEAAAKRMSADVINFSARGSSVSKGESLKDTALTLQAMGADGVVIRHSAPGAARRLADWVDGVVINAGDGTHEHPTQALLDAYTMRERLGRVEGLRVAIVGDIRHSRVARSNVLLLTTLEAERMHSSFFPSAREYSRRYGLDADRLARMADHAIVMHPGPMVRGMEISAEVADSARSTVTEQVTNGVSVRMAVLYLLLGGAIHRPGNQGEPR